MNDWRCGYLICEHIAAGDGSIDGCRHAGFRVCCEQCYLIQDDKGIPLLLYSDAIVTESILGDLAVMRLARNGM